jgi:hypothetical protein
MKVLCDNENVISIVVLKSRHLRDKNKTIINQDKQHYIYH